MSRRPGERGTAPERSTFLGLPRAVNTEHLRGQPFPVAARAAVADTQLRRNLEYLAVGEAAYLATLGDTITDTASPQKVGKPT